MRRVRRVRAAALAVVVAAAGATAAGCGGDDEPAVDPGSVVTLPAGGASVPVVTATAPERAAPPAATTTPAQGTEPTATSGPPSDPSGGTEAGDEEAIRVPAAFSVTDSAITPATVTVPAFLAVEIRVTAKDGKPHDVRIDAPGGGALPVAAGGTARVRLDGLQPGSYPVIADGGRVRATLEVTTEDPGP